MFFIMLMLELSHLESRAVRGERRRTVSPAVATQQRSRVFLSVPELEIALLGGAVPGAVVGEVEEGEGEGDPVGVGGSPDDPVTGGSQLGPGVRPVRRLQDSFASSHDGRPTPAGVVGLEPLAGHRAVRLSLMNIWLELDLIMAGEGRSLPQCISSRGAEVEFPSYRATWS